MAISRGQRGQHKVHAVPVLRALGEQTVQLIKGQQHKQRGPAVHAHFQIVLLGAEQEGGKQAQQRPRPPAELPAQEGDRRGQRQPKGHHRRQMIHPAVVAQQPVKAHQDEVIQGRVHIFRRALQHFRNGLAGQPDGKTLVAPKVVVKNAGKVQPEQHQRQQRRP